VSPRDTVAPAASVFEEHGLELAAPPLVALAERVFAIDFGQTCAWTA
jgi:hypothetical protein